MVLLTKFGNAAVLYEFGRHHHELHLTRYKESIMLIHLSILNVVVVMHGASLSLAAEVTCISVFPRFWMNFPMIYVQELPMTSTVAYIDSPSV